MTIPSLADLLPRVRGEHELREVLGQTSTSVIYRAGHVRRAGDPEECVVRALDPGLTTLGASLVEPWLAQMERRRGVVHPHVVMVWEAGVDEEGAFVVAPLVGGVSLQRLQNAVRRRGERLPWPVMGRILLDVLEGWGALDDVHGREGRQLERCLGQLRAGRVMIGLDGVSQLGDASDAVFAGLQQQSERWSEVSARWRQAPGDVWSVGLLGWEALAGRSFYPGTSARAALRWMAWRGSEMSTLGDVCPDVPYSVQAIVDRALNRDPDARWPTVGDMGDALAGTLGATCGPVDRALVGRCVRECLAQEERERASEAASAVPTSVDEVASYRDNALAGPPGRRVVPVGARQVVARRSFWRRLWAWLRG